MNRDQIEGKWKRFTGSARERWGKLTNNNWETVVGKKDNRALAQKGSEREEHGVASP